SSVCAVNEPGAWGYSVDSQQSVRQRGYPNLIGETAAPGPGALADAFTSNSVRARSHGRWTRLGRRSDGSSAVARTSRVLQAAFLMRAGSIAREPTCERAAQCEAGNLPAASVRVAFVQT